MAGWRYFAQRLLGDGTAELVHPDLPLTNVKIRETLSGPGGLQGTLSPRFSSLLGPNGRPLLDEWSTEIVAEEDGVIRGNGILVDSGFKGPDWVVDCATYSIYANKMPYLSSWSGVEVDPLDVVREMWSHIQSQPNGNLGLVVSSLLTGLKVGTELEQVEFDTESGPISFEAGPAKLNWWTTHDLQAEMDKYSRETPFDYVDRAQWVGDTVAHYLDFGYPRLGRRLNDLRFAIGENVGIPPIERNGDDYADEILGLGAGEGRTTVMAQVRRNSGRLRRVAVVEDKSARSMKSIRTVAEADLAWRKALEVSSSIDVIDHPNAPIGSVRPGDEIYLQGETDWLQVDTWYRVLETEIEPEAGGLMKLSILPADRMM
jgi:hypothetical protein